MLPLESPQPSPVDPAVIKRLIAFRTQLGNIEFRPALHAAIKDRWRGTRGHQDLITCVTDYTGVPYDNDPHEFVLNLRDARANRSFAKAVYFYVREQHPELTHIVDAEVAAIKKSKLRVIEVASPSQDSWEGAVAEALAKSEIKVIARDNMLDIVGLSTRTARVLQKVGLGEDFMLQYDSPFDGFAVSLQKYAGTWYPLAECVAITSGVARIPASNSLAAQGYLVEDTDAGLHTFAVALVASPFELNWPKEYSGALNPKMLDDWYRGASASKLALLASEVMFSA